MVVGATSSGAGTAVWVVVAGAGALGVDVRGGTVGVAVPRAGVSGTGVLERGPAVDIGTTGVGERPGAGVAGTGVSVGATAGSGRLGGGGMTINCVGVGGKM